MKKLLKYLILDNSGDVSCPSSIFNIYPSEEGKETFTSKADVFINIYDLLKSRLNSRFNQFCDDYTRIGFSSEKDLLCLNERLDKNQYFSIMMYLDYPISWYDQKENRLEEIILENSILLIFSSIRDLKGLTNFSISISFEHNLFSNHIVTAETFGTISPELYYFEPSAIINRLRIRNLALEIKTKYPELIIEFSARRTRIRPFDNFGFLEGAEYVVNPLD